MRYLYPVTFFFLIGACGKMSLNLSESPSDPTERMFSGIVSSRSRVAVTNGAIKQSGEKPPCTLWRYKIHSNNPIKLVSGISLETKPGRGSDIVKQIDPNTLLVRSKTYGHRDGALFDAANGSTVKIVGTAKNCLSEGKEFAKSFAVSFNVNPGSKMRVEILKGRSIRAAVVKSIKDVE